MPAVSRPKLPAADAVKLLRSFAGRQVALILLAGFSQPTGHEIMSDISDDWHNHGR